MKISVVIVTLNKNNLLEKCLDSILTEQTKLPDEVIIANGGRDADAILEKYNKRGVKLKELKLPGVSLGDGRNAGVKASSSDIVAVTDDDCRVCTGWVEGYLKIFEEDNSIGSTGGRTFDANSRGIAHNIENVALLLEDYYHKEKSPFCYFFSTRNVCFNKKILEDVGFFESTYRDSFEDVIVGIKIFKAGYKNVYTSALYVDHYGRSTITKLLKRQFEYGRDMYAGTVCFADMPMGYIFKARRSVFYIILSTFFGPVRDACRFKDRYNPFIMFFSSFVMKLFVNAGIVYEKLFGRNIWNKG